MLKVLIIMMLEMITTIDTSVSCLHKVVYQIEHMHEKNYEIESQLGSQFRSRYIFTSLANKGPWME